MVAPKRISSTQDLKRCPFCPAILTSRELQRHIDALHTAKPVQQRSPRRERAVADRPQPTVQPPPPAVLQYGPFQLGTVAEARRLAPQPTISGVRTAGSARVFTATDQQGTTLEIAYIVWDNDEREVRALTITAPDQAVRLLEGGRRRLGIQPYRDDPQQAVIELSQARIKAQGESGWSNLFMASQEELDEGAGLDVCAALVQAGARQSGTKAQLLHEGGTRRNYLCAIFPAEQRLVPVVAFLLTRVLPLQRTWRKAH